MTNECPDKDKLKICVACSPGGHLVEVRHFSPAYQKYDFFYFTFDCDVAEKLRNEAPVYSIPNIARYNPLSWLKTAIRSFRIIRKEKPDVILTTGAGIVIFLCLFAKLFGAKLIFIESMAKVTSPTMTARVLYPFSDLFLVQWPELLHKMPQAQFHGRMF